MFCIILNGKSVALENSRYLLLAHLSISVPTMTLTFFSVFDTLMACILKFIRLFNSRSCRSREL